jgi:octanoyl-[GcvH]:protein N-octanoyltransferase
VTSAFGGPFQVIDDTRLPADARPAPADYASWVQQQLSNLRVGDPGIIRFRRPRPTAAFSPQDTTHANYEQVKRLARASGFEPIERGTGGRLTMFDENALGITIISPHPEPHPYMMQRYEVFAGVIANALVTLGIDAQIGELPNEYCPGKFSINAQARIKLVGIAQRMRPKCLQMGAIIAVELSDAACTAISEAYRAMDLPFDPGTYGAISDFQPALTYDQVTRTMIAAVTEALAPT